VDYRKSDKPYDRPELASFAEDWDRTIIEVVRPLDDRLMAVAKALRKTHVNGGAVVAQCRIEAVGAAATALATNRLRHVGFFPSYFGERSNGMRKPALDAFIREQLAKAPLVPRKDKDGRFAAVANEIFLELINA
jgi:hypothetical protein